jgi:hypothetical protein
VRASGRYNVIYVYHDELVAAGELAVRLINHVIVPDPGFDFDFDEALERFIVRGERTAFGPSTHAIVEEAVSRDIPCICGSIAHHSCNSARGSSETDPGHHDLSNALSRG